jgi:hypothetical protein
MKLSFEELEMSIALLRAVILAHPATGQRRRYQRQ